MVPRESDIANGFKFGGWTNPLSWTDDGMDDDSILNMHFDSDVDKYRKEHLSYDNSLDDDIITTLENESNSEKSVKE